MHMINNGPNYMDLMISLRRKRAYDIHPPARVCFQLQPYSKEGGWVWAVIEGMVLAERQPQGFYIVTGLAFDSEDDHKNARPFKALYCPDDRKGQFEFLR